MKKKEEKIFQVDLEIVQMDIFLKKKWSLTWWCFEWLDGVGWPGASM
jgi:hypothetical protein